MVTPTSAYGFTGGRRHFLCVYMPFEKDICFVIVSHVLSIFNQCWSMLVNIEEKMKRNKLVPLERNNCARHAKLAPDPDLANRQRI